MICEVKIESTFVIKAIDYYTNFNTIVVTTDKDIIKIGQSQVPKRASETGVQLPLSVLSQVCCSTLFEVGSSEYRACGLASGELALVDGDDLNEWGEGLIKLFQPMTSLKLSKTLDTECGTVSAEISPNPKSQKARAIRPV